MSNKMSITLNGNDLGVIDDYVPSVIASLMHQGIPGGGTADALATTTGGPLRTFSITSQVPVDSSASLFTALQGMVSGFQEIDGPYTLSVSGSSLFPTESVEVFISSFSMVGIPDVVTHVQLNIQLMEGGW